MSTTCLKASAQMTTTAATHFQGQIEDSNVSVSLRLKCSKQNENVLK